MSCIETKIRHCGSAEAVFPAQYMCTAKLLCALLLSRQMHTLLKSRSNAAARALSVQSALYFQAKSVAQWSQAQICN